MNKINLLIIGTIFLFVTISCSSIMKGKNLAEPAAEKFHSQYDAKEFGAIYAQADDGFKKVVPEDKWKELLEKVHEKLGKVKKADSTGWKVNTTNGMTIATITYDVEFSEGKGTEEFMFHIVDEKALLYNYEVNSPLLITK